MALIPGLAALLLYYRGLRSTPAAAASIAELAFPITALVANWLLLGVRLAPSQLAGGAVLVAAITALGAVEPAPRATAPTAATASDHTSKWTQSEH